MRLDPTRVGRDANRIADEMIAHFAGQLSAEVTVTIEIEATLADGSADESVRRKGNGGTTRSVPALAVSFGDAELTILGPAGSSMPRRPHCVHGPAPRAARGCRAAAYDPGGVHQHSPKGGSSMTAVERLRAWADSWPNNRTISVTKRPTGWVVTVAVPSPVKFGHSAVNDSLETASSECIAALVEVGEDVPV